MFEFNATFLVSMISFIVFIIIMNTIFYKPILGIIEERDKFINDNYSDAKNSEEKAEKLLADKEKRLEETLKTSRKIIMEKTLEANKKSKDMINTAKLNYQNEVQTAKNELKTQEEDVDLNRNIEELSDSISKKLLGEV